MKPLPTKPVGDVCEFVRGITFKPTDLVEAGAADSLACFRTKNVQAKLSDEDLIHIPHRFVKTGRQLVQDGDILLSTANSFNLVGKCCFVPRLDYGATLGGFIAAARAKPEQIHPRYLYYWFASPATQKRLRGLARQTTNIANLPLSDVAKEHVPMLPLAEQKRIADLLDEADRLRELRAQADLRTVALLPALFHTMFGDPLRNAGDMPVVRVGDAGRVQLGRQRAPKYQTGTFTRPYVRVANVYEDRIDISDVLSMDFDERDFVQYKLEHGDILLNEGQSTELVGRPAMWRNEVLDCCFQNTLIRFQPDRARVLPDFALALFLVYFRTGEFAKVSSKTSNVAHLGASRFAQMPFVLPPLSLQVKFAERVVEVRQLEAKQATSRVHLDALFHSTLHCAFEGEL